MKDRLLIVGTGGHAKEVFDVAESLWMEVSGFLEENDSEKTEFRGRPVVGNLEDVEWDVAVVAIGNNVVRAEYCQRFADRLSEALVHPSAVVASSASIGPGTVIMPLSIVSSDAVVGTGVIVGAHVYVGHDNVIGDFSHIATGASLNGTVSVGAGTLVGTGTVVRQNIGIGANAVCGAGSVVVEDVSDGMIVIGCPARPMGYEAAEPDDSAR